MSRLAAAVLGCLLTTSAFSQDGAIKMSGDELRSFLPGTRVTHISSVGSERHWTNQADGTFFATSSNKLFGSATGTQTGSHAGTWAVNDEGKYCVDIDWKRIHEQWCAFVLKGQDGLFYLNVADDKHRISFAR